MHTLTIELNVAVLAFVAGVASTIWYLLGLYGAWMSTSTCESNQERWEFFVDLLREIGFWKSLLLSMLILVLAAFGPITLLGVHIYNVGQRRRMEEINAG